MKMLPRSRPLLDRRASIIHRYAAFVVFVKTGLGQHEGMRLQVVCRWKRGSSVSRVQMRKVHEIFSNSFASSPVPAFFIITLFYNIPFYISQKSFTTAKKSLRRFAGCVGRSLLAGIPLAFSYPSVSAKCRARQIWKPLLMIPTEEPSGISLLEKSRFSRVLVDWSSSRMRSSVRPCSSRYFFMAELYLQGSLLP